MSMTDEEVKKQLADAEFDYWDYWKDNREGSHRQLCRIIAEERKRRKIAEETEELLYDDLVRSSKSFEEYEREAEARLRSCGEI